jgi:Cft2 family RNA processing exonuclease
MKLKPLKQRYHQYGYYPEDWRNPVISKAIELHANYPITKVEKEKKDEQPNTSSQADSPKQTNQDNK